MRFFCFFHKSAVLQHPSSSERLVSVRRPKRSAVLAMEVKPTQAPITAEETLNATECSPLLHGCPDTKQDARATLKLASRIEGAPRLLGANEDS